ncbi:MAG TPA: carbohydrate-binding protein, partial [Gemmataceae bacterium]|nr:carbohydrate-binding protein [Gemmataceae bacterium]
LGQPRRLFVGLGLAYAPFAVSLGRDDNGNGALDGNEIFFKFTTSGRETVRSLNLPAGTFLVKVTTTDPAGKNYGIQLAAAPTDDAGDTPAAARTVALAGSAATLTDFLGDGTRDFADDADDFYRFTVTDGGPFVFTGQLGGVTGLIGLQLIRDENLNRQVDDGEVLATTTGVVTGASSFLPPVPIVVPLLTPGTYYMRVQRVAGQTVYTLSLSAVSVDSAGNTLAAARDLGPLTTTLTATEFVGRIDTSDVYRFSVTGAAELEAVLTGALPGTGIEVIRDADNDLAVEPGETLASTAGLLLTDDRMNGIFLPSAGQYFVRIVSGGSDNSYNLDLTFSAQTPFSSPFQVTDAAATTIEAELFDRGGEGVAYHDTTAGNSGSAAAFRISENIRVDVSTTTDPLGGVRRIANTAPGEFLEYTLNVTATGLYTFEFRVASAASGATFHAEIDGTEVTQSIPVPNTGSGDSFVTVAVADISLLAGPHILRLAMDTATAGGAAGNYNFITIRPAAQSTGTFALTPAQSTVPAEQHARLALTWTVPTGGWRTLRDVQLRLRDETGTALWVKFNEAANTLSLYNPATGTFGPAKTLGSSAVLSNGAATVHLAASTVQAAGPASPTVALTLDLTFRRSVAGRHFRVEVAASDDQGRSQPFELAGFLDVTDPVGLTPRGKRVGPNR